VSKFPALLGRTKTILLCVGCGLAFLSSQPTQAAGNCQAVDGILQNLQPVSQQYTAQVLARAQEGIDFAMGLQGGFDDNAFLFWLNEAYRSMSQVADEELHTLPSVKDLEGTTSCLRIDLFLIQTMMEKTRCSIEQAFTGRNNSAVAILREVLFFLNDRYAALLKGARDNTYEDLRWWNEHTFDKPQGATWLSNVAYSDTYCCYRAGDTCAVREKSCPNDAQYLTEDACIGQSQCITRENQKPTDYKMCPFDSDYLPPTIIVQWYALDPSKDPPNNVEYFDEPVPVGYGCDLTVLSRYRGLYLDGTDFDEALRSEYVALDALIRERDDFIEDAMEMKENAQNIDSWLGRPPNQALQYFGWTRETKKKGTGDDAETEQVREHRARLGCSEQDGYSTDLPEAPEERWPPDWPEGMAAQEKRGPFSVDERVLKLMRSYQDWHLRLAEERPYPDQYKFPEEFPPALQEQARNDFQYVNLITRTLQYDYGRRFFRDEHIKQATFDSLIAGKALDSPRHFAAMFTPLRAATSEFSQMGNSLDEGVRNFAKGFAYFLRRSCLNRPCNERLERILKIVFQDDCFPYTDGQYVGDTNVHKTCEEAAEL